ncbi:MAG: M50 family metallopeptidase [Candidatus Saccharibacteria bacterium]|nr:M50 family metallopeptidase [Candidatus Saccharibacteria bacterium]
MQTVLGIIVGLLVLVFLVTIHELGHAIAAIRNGVKVEEFGIGFPPTAWSKRLKNGILFKINLIPLGGYVRLQGEHDSANKKGDYGAASLWAKTKILFAGVAMNFLFACVVMTILAITGLPVVLNDQFRLRNDGRLELSPVKISAVSKDSPAYESGLKTGNVIVSVNGEKVDSSDKLRSLTKQHAGQKIELAYRERDNGELKNILVNLNNEEIAKSKGYLGAVPNQTSVIYATWSAPIVGVGTVLQFMEVTLHGLGDLMNNFFSGLVQKISSDQTIRQLADQKLAAAGESVAGPVGLLGVIFPALIGGSMTNFWLFVAIISLTLAVMNALPIPALDGGRWFVTMIFRLLNKPLGEELESKIHGLGMLALLILSLIITVSDVFKFF